MTDCGNVDGAVKVRVTRRSMIILDLGAPKGYMP